jgi:hypothetical protein
MRNVTSGATQDQNGNSDLILSSLRNREITPNGKAMMGAMYGIQTDCPGTWKIADWLELCNRADQMAWLKEHLPKIKEKFKALIEGQVAWDTFQAELIKDGWKGAEKIEKATIEAFMGEAKFAEVKNQQQFRLETHTAMYAQQTAASQQYFIKEAENLLADYTAGLDARLQAMEKDPALAEAIAQWKINGQSAEEIERQKISLILEHSESALTHPKYLQLAGLSNQSAAPVGFAQSYQQQAPRPRDEIAFQWRGDVAASTKKVVGGAIGTLMRGFRTLGNYATGTR